MNNKIGLALTQNPGLGLVVGGALVVGLVWYLFRDKLAAGAEKVVEAVNPTSDRNLAYRGYNAFYGKLYGIPDFSLGSWLYDVFHEDYDPNRISNPQPQTADEGSWWDSLTSRISGG